MAKIDVRNQLTAPHLGMDSAVHSLIKSRTRLPADTQSEIDRSPYCAERITTITSSLWDAHWWGLYRSELFARLSLDQQNEVLHKCNSALLEEAYFIEKSGLAYTAKMILTAESTDVAQLYALVAADEAKHLAWIEPYIDSPAKTRPAGHFLAFLSSLIEETTPQLLVYLVQIILEGWGLDHYRRLAESVSDGHLAVVLTNILKDEALHHKSGRVLFDFSKLSSSEVLFMTHCLQTYTEMVKVGPQTAVGIIDEVAGGLDPAQIQKIFEALGHQSASARKLSLLSSLMRQPGVERVIRDLDDCGSFVAIDARAAADFYCSHR